MQIGPRSWKWFSTDSANVPTGGKYGNVKRFEERAQRYGLHVAWSGIFGLFIIYTKHGLANPVMQEVCGDEATYQPYPLTDFYLARLVCIWEKFARHTKHTIHLVLSQAKKERKAEAKREYEEWARLTEKDAIRAYELRMGQRTPTTLFRGGINRG